MLKKFYITMTVLSRRAVLFPAVLLALLLCFFQPLPGLCANSMIGGYWENWNGAINPGSESTSDPDYYANDLASFNLVYYSFLTLAKTPDSYSPPDQQWDGVSIYESMTAADVLTVMTATDPAWENPYNWQRVKIQAIIDECHASDRSFIWAIGGWSDLTRTISDDQISAFVTYCVNLLQLAGDGIDFDWEHLSDHADISTQQRTVLGRILPALRLALDEAGLTDKKLGYTTRFNAFWNATTRPSGVTAFDTDGEGLDIATTLTGQGSSFEQVVDWVNIMLYDVPPADLGASGGFTLDTYKTVLGFFDQYVPRARVVMGFEPGGQAAGGVWEGMEVDKEVIDYIKLNGYGGVMFWAVNQPASSSDPDEVTGENAQALALYALQNSPIILAPLILPLLLDDQS